MSDYKHMMDSEMVYPDTRGMDDGPDYDPRDDYPGDDAPDSATDVEELQCALDGVEASESRDDEIASLRLALSITLTRWPEVEDVEPQ